MTLELINKGGMDMSVTDFNAARKWREIPKEFQQRLINNVFCKSCFDTTIVDFTMHDDENGIILKGKCKKCGGDVARLIEDA